MQPEPGSQRKWHLARTPHEAATTEFEWSLLRFQQAWERWVTQLADVAGMGDLSYIESVVLHVIRMQDRPKTAAQIARQLNRDDIPNIQYCLRKLEKMGLCRKVKEKTPKTFAYEATEAGRTLTDNYADLRRQILTEQTMIIGQVDSKLAEASKLINLLTGMYDEAGRISGTYSSLHNRPPPDAGSNR
ncbi:MAG: winged helix DNA-binding protein [Gammaproteobacteria bacterium]|nr:winged helix DNA-binding protein [Gammaproteobacteria bacterium]